MPINLPTEWIVGIVVAVAGYIGLRIKLHYAKKQGREEVKKQILELDYGKLLDFTKKKEVIHEETDNLKSCVPNDWDSVRKDGVEKFSQYPGSGVCEEVQGQDGPDKAPKSP